MFATRKYAEAKKLCLRKHFRMAMSRKEHLIFHDFFRFWSELREERRAILEMIAIGRMGRM